MAHIHAAFQQPWLKYGAFSILIHGLMVSMVSPSLTPGKKEAPPIEVVIMDQRPLPPVEAAPVAKPRTTMRRVVPKPAVVREPPPGPPPKPETPHESPASGNPAPILRDAVMFRDAPAGIVAPDDGVALQATRGSGTGSGDGFVHARPSGTGNGPGAGGGIDRTGGGSGPSQAEFGALGGPRFLHREVPEYPLLARRRKKEGTVSLMITIDERGKLLKVDVTAASDPVFVGPSVEAVKRSTFIPARRNGVPVAVKAILPIRFALSDS